VIAWRKDWRIGVTVAPTGECFHASAGMRRLHLAAGASPDDPIRAPKADRKTNIPCEFAVDRWRHHVENFFCNFPQAFPPSCACWNIKPAPLKQWRWIATRCAKIAPLVDAHLARRALDYLDAALIAFHSVLISIAVPPNMPPIIAACNALSIRLHLPRTDKNRG
jgi:hypothetical protein